MTEDKRSRVLGMIASLVSRGQFPKPTAEPVAFLYGHVAKEGETPTHTINGVDYVGWIGPKLPVVEGYPFRVLSIKTYESMDIISVGYYCFAEPFGVADSEKGIYLPTGTPWCNVSVSRNSEDWKTEEIPVPDEGVTSMEWWISPTWANYDVLNADRKVYLEATEPVPVYE